MRILTPIAASCAAAVVVGTLGFTAPDSAAAGTITPDVEEIPLTDLNESGLNEDGARASSTLSAAVTNQSATVNVPGAYSAVTTSLGSTNSEPGLGGNESDDADTSGPELGEAHQGEASTEPSAEPSAETDNGGISGGAQDKTEDGANIASISDVLAVPSDNPSVVGITYTGTSTVAFEVRTETNGTWSAWTELESENTGEGNNGTEPFIISQAQNVQVRVLGDNGAPAETQLVLVDPKRSADDATAVANNAPVLSEEETGSDATTAENADLTGETTQAGVATATNVDFAAANTAAKVTKPSIASRESWGANESLRGGSPDYADEVKATIIHHTAGSNSYSEDDVPGILRGIYTYHTQGRGWNDVGYNVLIDKFGRAWQGRAGDIDRAVIGAHAVNYNTGTFGVSVMGSYGSKAPSSVALNMLAQVIAWKFSLDGVSAKGKATVNGHKINTISAHRDVGSTDCPGDAFYAKLGSIRNDVADILENGSAQEKETEEADDRSEIEKAYEGQEKTLGDPIGKVTEWGNGEYQEYENGFIAHGSKTGTRVLIGEIAQAWVKNRDVIGLPNGNMGDITDGNYQSFENGAIHYSKANGAFATWGDIWTYWKSKGFERGHLGYPTEDPVTDGSRVEQAFEGGILLYLDDVGVSEHSVLGSITGGVRDLNKTTDSEDGEAPESDEKEDSKTDDSQEDDSTEEESKEDESKEAESEKDESKKDTEESEEDTEDAKRDAIIATAKKYLGVPYVWGGTSPTSGWDCSGYVQYVFGKNGIDLPRTSSQQRYAGTVVSEKNAKPGDIIWVSGHVGIVSETEGQMYDAGSSRTDTSKRSYDWMLKRGAKFIRVVD